ncbi:MAG: diguanylate cyclase [Deltaproteobacteria bacterium]|nr:diguanylate cyclase [Deltaproteobacteria bacterium]
MTNRPSQDNMEPKVQNLEEQVRRGRRLLEAYLTIVESTSDFIFLVDHAGRYLLLNLAYSTWLGLSANEIRGKHYDDFHSQLDSRQFHECLEEVVSTGKSLSHEYRSEKDQRIFLQTFSPVRSLGPDNGITSISVIAKDVTDSKHTEEALRLSEEKTLELLENIDDSYYEVDLKGNFKFLNRQAQRRISESRNRYYLDANFREFMSPEDAKRMLEIFNEVYRTKAAKNDVPLDFVTDEGIRNIEISVSPINDVQDNVVGFRGISRDVTERNMMMERIRQSEERYRSIIENIEDGYYEVDLLGKPLFCNDAYLKILGYTREEWIASSFTEYMDKDNADRLANMFIEIFEAGRAASGIEWELKRKDGQIINMEETASLIKDAKGEPVGFRGLVRNVTERKNHETIIRQLAYHDFLTGLPNRLLFFDRFTVALEMAKRNKQPLAIMVIDLDGFKTVNDTYGHHIGDLLLQAVADLLQNVVRKSDTVARMGGDEFTLLLPLIKELKNTHHVADKILQNFKRMFVLGEHRLTITPSIGIAVFPDHGDDADTLLKHADAAMYQAKDKGKNSYQI